MLRILRDAYGQRGLEAAEIDALSLVLLRYDGALDDEALTSRLAKTAGGLNGLLTPAQALRKVMGQPFIQCLAASIVTIYNRDQRTGKLAAWWRE